MHLLTAGLLPTVDLNGDADSLAGKLIRLDLELLALGNFLDCKSLGYIAVSVRSALRVCALPGKHESSHSATGMQDRGAAGRATYNRWG